MLRPIPLPSAGILEAVTSLVYTVHNSELFFTWVPPESLDVTGVHPDVTYCLEVINSITLHILQSECNVSVAEFNYTIPDESACYITMVTVTSVNKAGIRGGRRTVSYIGASTRERHMY